MLKNYLKLNLYLLISNHEKYSHYFTFSRATSCSSVDNKTIGNTLGAAAGGVIGTQFGAGTGKLFITAIGAGLGSLVGGEIADELSVDKVKKKCEELGFEENTPEFQIV